MKKLWNRLLSLLIASAILFGALPSGALAAGGGAAEAEIERSSDGAGGYIAMVENEETLGGGASLLNDAQTFGAPPFVYEGGDLYSQLNTRQKACYNVLESISIDSLISAGQIEHNNRVYRRVMVKIEGINGLSMEGSFSGGHFTPAKSAAEVESGIYTDLCAAIVALRYDRPDILWMSYMRYGYELESTGNNSGRVTNVRFEFHLEYGGREKAMRETMLENARRIADQAGQEADTYHKVKAVHDLLARENTYGDTKDSMAHSAYSALVFGDVYEPVCDGYAKAFKIICGLMGIPCVMPSSNDHMWNNVKMDDNEWYNLDLTWDDNDDSTISYEYFLVGSQTVVNGEAFSAQESHREVNPYSSYLADGNGLLKPVSLSFPRKNTQAYQYLGEDYPPLAFPDVKRGAWYFEDVENAAKLGLFAGDAHGLFHPENNITRAEFAKVMANSFGVDLSAYGGKSFTDVAEDAWYAPTAAWAKESGLMNGYTDGTFRPGNPISRQEMCVVLYNACKNMGIQAEPAANLFPDDAKVGGWAREAVYGCNALGLVKGDASGRFDPQGKTLRSHAAVVFGRFAELERPVPQN